MTEQTDTTTQRKTVLFVTTADTDILTAERALSGMPGTSSVSQDTSEITLVW